MDFLVDNVIKAPSNILKSESRKNQTNNSYHGTYTFKAI